MFFLKARALKRTQKDEENADDNMYCESDRVVAGRLAAQGDCASNGRKAAIRERSLAQKEVEQWPGCLSVASSRPSPTSQDKSQRASPVSHELAASQYKQGFSRDPLWIKV